VNGTEPILRLIGDLPPGTPVAFGWGWLVRLLEDYGGGGTRVPRRVGRASQRLLRTPRNLPASCRSLWLACYSGQ
jgi:hypothetical protein